jgi:hypothetical protein
MFDENEIKLGECLVDGHFGIYVPQRFAELYGDGCGAETADIEILKGDVDSLLYWETWECVLDDARIDGYRIYQDESGDVFTVEWLD